MKNLLIAAVALLLIPGCKQKELDQANHQKDSLSAVVNDREKYINEFIASFNEVEINLDSVAARQHLISVNTDKPGELKPTQKERINAQISAINNLMDENRKKIADLSRKLKNSGHKNAELEKMINLLNGQLAQKDVELAELNQKLNELNAQVAELQTNVSTLKADGEAKAQTIAQTTEALHTAYYVVGKPKELQTEKVINRKGGLLGIGKTSILASNFDNSKFTRVDYTQTSTIPVNSKDVKVITTHPSDSYTLTKDTKDPKMITTLSITNPEKFWSASKYLVVLKD